MNKGLVYKFMYFFMFAEFSSFRSIYDLHMEKLPKQKSQIRVYTSSLGGGFNPSEKYARQIGSFPQIGMNIKNI